jgi:6-pyruvoyltetrahydropterin/6-carboxytetrahydropterin synthase
MKKLDHNFLNELDYFDDNTPPSSENIALYIANSLQTMLKDPEVKVTSVTPWESENACATYLTSSDFHILKPGDCSYYIAVKR